jgi:hypothetical protein
VSKTDGRAVLRELALHASSEGRVTLSGARLAALLAPKGVGSRTAWVRLRDRLVASGALEVLEGSLASSGKAASSSVLVLTAEGLRLAQADSSPDNSADSSADSSPRAPKPFGNERKETSPQPLPLPHADSSPDNSPDSSPLVSVLRELVAAVLSFQPSKPEPAPRETRPPEPAPVVHRDVKPESAPTKERRVVQWDTETLDGKALLKRAAEVVERYPAPKGKQQGKPRDVRFYPFARVELVLNHLEILEAEGKLRGAGLLWSALKDEKFEFYAEANAPHDVVQRIAQERRNEREAAASAPKAPDAAYLALVARPPPPSKVGSVVADAIRLRGQRAREEART